MFPVIIKALFLIFQDQYMNHTLSLYFVCLVNRVCLLIKNLVILGEVSPIILRANGMNQEILEDFKFLVTLSKCICIFPC